MLQYSHTAHQRVPARKDAHLINTHSQILVVLWLQLGLMTVPAYLLEEGGWNLLLSLAAVKQLAHRGRTQVVVRLKGQ